MSHRPTTLQVRASCARRLGVWCAATILPAVVTLLYPTSSAAQRIARRAQAPSGQAHASVSFMERSLTVPAPGLCQFDYFVDSEAGHDYLRLRHGGAVLFEVSGPSRAGRRAGVIAGDSAGLNFAEGVIR